MSEETKPNPEATPETPGEKPEKSQSPGIRR